MLRVASYGKLFAGRRRHRLAKPPRERENHANVCSATVVSP
jgi:hypothetical protein